MNGYEDSLMGALEEKLDGFRKSDQEREALLLVRLPIPHSAF